MNDELLTTVEAGAVVGYAPQTLAAMRCRGVGPRYVRLSARRIRYRREDLVQWLRSCAVDPR